jgi:hypothetical protein
VDAGRQQRCDLLFRLLTIGASFQEHIQAIELAQACEAPLRGRHVGERDQALERGVHFHHLERRRALADRQQ